MKMNKFVEILKKSFGKQKDERYHAIAMLAIYGIFFIILVIILRIGAANSPQIDNNDNNSSNSNSTINSPLEKDENNQSNEKEEPTTEEDTDIENDINYTYSYTINYNDKNEVFLGKKIDTKEKFTHIKDGVTTDYAILNDNYLILENGSYHVTSNPSKLFKYCDIDQILSIIEEQNYQQDGNTRIYTVSNYNLKKYFKDNFILNNERDNTIKLTMVNNELKKVNLDFSNYITSIEGTKTSLTINMEFVDVGITENFEINISTN